MNLRRRVLTNLMEDMGKYIIQGNYAPGSIYAGMYDLDTSTFRKFSSTNLVNCLSRSADDILINKYKNDVLYSLKNVDLYSSTQEVSCMIHFDSITHTEFNYTNMVMDISNGDLYAIRNIQYTYSYDIYKLNMSGEIIDTYSWNPGAYCKQIFMCRNGKILLTRYNVSDTDNISLIFLTLGSNCKEKVISTVQNKYDYFYNFIYPSSYLI